MPNLEKILKAIVMLLADTTLLNSTHLRSNLVEILLALAPTDTHNALSVQLAYLFEPKDDSSFMAQLGPALMALYVHIEHTGRDSQFYEKFNVLPPQLRPPICCSPACCTSPCCTCPLPCTSAVQMVGWFEALYRCGIRSPVCSSTCGAYPFTRELSYGTPMQCGAAC